MTALAPAKSLGKRIINPGEYKYTWNGFTDEGDREKRNIITAKLKDKALGILMHRISFKQFKKLGVTDTDGKLEIQYRGIGIAKAYVGGKSNGEIKVGEPICFDMTTGDSVTGVHESWNKSEYRTMGIALEDFNEDPPYENNENLIMVWLHPVQSPGSAGKLFFTGEYRGPGRVLRQDKQIPGYFSGYEVNIVNDTLDGHAIKRLEITEEAVPLIHAGKRDVRPNSFVFAVEEQSSGEYVITTEYLE